MEQKTSFMQTVTKGNENLKQLFRSFKTLVHVQQLL